MASFLGWALDAFDFFVLVFVLTKAAKEFELRSETFSDTLRGPLAFFFGQTEG